MYVTSINLSVEWKKNASLCRSGLTEILICSTKLIEVNLSLAWFHILIKIAGEYVTFTHSDCENIFINHSASTYFTVRGIFESILWRSTRKKAIPRRLAN